MCWSGSSPAVLGYVKGEKESAPDTTDEDAADLLRASAAAGDEPRLIDQANEQAYRDWLRENANDNDIPASPADLVPLWSMD